ncbi:MAG: hypothetical protein GWN71_23095, partial [Gammaproteobacteria bacterium]|nr:hypothetical protein [Gemmatimonadota bacterium]NIU76340.1 hypothetical protein [Gammaproteobacteria bacterium]
PDHQAGHAYALSLPIPRWRYVLLKMADGAIFLLPAALVFWFGALLAAGSVTLPDGLHAYPTLLAMRFWMAMLLAYAVLFALAAGSVRTILIVVGGVFGGLLVGEVVVRFLDAFVLALEGWSFIRAVLDVLSGWPGPFRVYAGNWMLIDV